MSAIERGNDKWAVKASPKAGPQAGQTLTTDNLDFIVLADIMVTQQGQALLRPAGSFVLDMTSSLHALHKPMCIYAEEVMHCAHMLNNLSVQNRLEPLNSVLQRTAPCCNESRASPSSPSLR